MCSSKIHYMLESNNKYINIPIEDSLKFNNGIILSCKYHGKSYDNAKYIYKIHISFDSAKSKSNPKGHLMLMNNLCENENCDNINEWLEYLALKYEIHIILHEK